MRFLAAALLLGCGLAAPAAAQQRRNTPQAPQRVVLPDGRTWERIPLQYLDVRVLTALAGAPNLPTEMDLYRMRYGGGMRGGYGGYGGPMGGYAGPGFGGGPFGGRTILGDPNSNSILVGPGRSGAGGAGGRQPAGNNRLFPGLILFGDPNTNSLIVDP